MYAMNPSLQLQHRGPFFGTVLLCEKRGLCVVLESEIRDPENKLDVILLVRRKPVLVHIDPLGAHSYCKSEV